MAASETPKRKSWLLPAVICIAAAAGGFAVPVVLDMNSAGAAAGKTTEKTEVQPALVSFGEHVVVNLAEERLSRYLRVKLLLVVDAGDERAVSERLEKKKSFLKSWLLSYLSDQTVQGIGGAAGQNRIRREIRDHFNAMLFPNEAEKINDILFEEFNVQ